MLKIWARRQMPLDTQRAPWGGKSSTRQGAAQVIIWIRVTTGKAGDPQIGAAPIGLRKTLGDPPAAHTTCGAHLSMSRPARPWENGKCESFMKTLKREEVDARRYPSFAELQQHLEEFLEQIYNRVRLHSALDYRSPDEFEQAQQSAEKWRPGVLNFLRHEEVHPHA